MAHMEKYLRDKAYYEDLYDERTVEECLHYEKTVQAVFRERIREMPTKDQPMLMPNVPYIVAGERYTKKEEVIAGWMERDKQRDEMLEDAKQPYFFCPECKNDVELMYKSIRFGWDNAPDRVEFRLLCRKCKHSRHLYEDGSEISPIVLSCEKCGHELSTDVDIQRKGKTKVVTYSEKCTHCDYANSRTEVEKPPTKAERERFENAKRKYCFSFSEGEDYRQWQRNLHELMASMKDKEEFSEAHETVKQYQKLSVTGLTKHLKPLLKKGGFDKLKISEPDVGRSIAVGIKVQDMSDDRGENQSKKALKDLLSDALKETNWNTMSEGITYRLGILSTRLRGFESDEELLSLAKQRTSKVV